ncbi:MAG: 16S rRNA (uracil(1498)-N(3))-methyltransferase [Planktomarina sp.]|nr:16S rRNA (uracil(1498)-N(3))-methyltransferase [Planktomarina sp.]
MASVIRLYVDHPLAVGQSVPLTVDQSHYLFRVMRKGVGEKLEIFNGVDGEWSAKVIQSGKKVGILLCENMSKPLILPPNLWLMFAPLKKSRSEFVVEKATEMGVSQIMPVKTDFTNLERIRQDRLQSQAVEAAEQCGGTFVPAVLALQKLSNVLDVWGDRQIMFCDETFSGKSLDLSRLSGPWAILIGPEGGFSTCERKRLKAMVQVHRMALGPRILRAETAAVAALTLWQSTIGDWE